MNKTKKLLINVIITLVILLGTLLPTTHALAKTNGWVANGQDWSYYTNDQVVRNDWIKDSSERWYYMNNYGSMSTRWAKDGSTWYFLGVDGVRVSNKWVQSGQTWYYLGHSGAMVASGWAQDSRSKKWYYFDENGAMLSNRWIRNYYLGADGARTTVTNNSAKVHYINGGQADSILIQQDGYNMLIDGGNNDDSDLIINYLKQQGVTSLDYIIATHSDEDHIGGLDAVLDTFDVSKVILPKVTTITNAYNDVINSINNKNLNITDLKVGNTYSLGSAEWTILAPNGDNYDDLNNSSVVINLKYGNKSFIFNGDAEDILDNQGAANQNYELISVDTDDKDGYPTQNDLDKLEAKGVGVYSTNENGTVIATVDGINVNFNARPWNNSNVQITNENLEKEIVAIKNNSNTDINMSGCKLVIGGWNQIYIFPNYMLKANSTVYVTTGRKAKKDEIVIENEYEGKFIFKTPIVGKTECNAAELEKYLLSNSPNPKFNMPVSSFCELWITEGDMENIKGDIAFCQALHETGFFKFGGQVLPEQNNFGGIGATNSSGIGKGAWFESVQEGIRASIQHLKAYASTEPLKEECVDPRFHLVTKGRAPNFEDLGGKWAWPGYNKVKYSSLEKALEANNSYGHSILKKYEQLKKVVVK